jgi:hypothetical protein
MTPASTRDWKTTNVRRVTMRWSSPIRERMAEARPLRPHRPPSPLRPSPSGKFQDQADDLMNPVCGHLLPGLSVARRSAACTRGCLGDSLVTLIHLILELIPSLQKLEVGSPAPRSNRRSEMSSPSTSTSSGAQSLTQSQLESPRDSCETQVKTMESTSTPLPVASYPEYFPLPDFPSLSEADLPSHRRDSESMNDNSNEVFVAGAVAGEFHDRAHVLFISETNNSV